MQQNNTLLPEVKAFLKKRESIPPKERIPLPHIDTLPQKILDIAEELISISGTWNPVEIYTADPDSIIHEQANLFEAFLATKPYTPTLTYSHTQNTDLAEEHDRLSQLLAELEKYTPSGSLAVFAKKACLYKIRDDLSSCHLAENMNQRNELAVKKILSWKYPGTDTVLMKIAQQYYEELTTHGSFGRDTNESFISMRDYAKLQSLVLSPEQQMKGFAFGLKQYGILRTKEEEPGYNLIIDDRATALDVRDKTPLGPSLFIPTKRATPMTAAKFLPLLAHEVEGHARQSMIGQSLFLFGGGALKIDDEQLYEGYAIRMEEDCRHELFGIEKRIPRVYYPFAVRMAEQGSSFYEIFTDQVERRLRITYKIPLSKPLPPIHSFARTAQDKAMHQAWRVTYRVMRGHSDMSNNAKFAMAKDLGYLRGRLIDRQLESLGYGYVNESSVIPVTMLPLYAQFAFSTNDIPKQLQFKNVAKQYWLEVLQKQLHI